VAGLEGGQERGNGDGVWPDAKRQPLRLWACVHMGSWRCAQLDGRREAFALHCLTLAGYETYQPRIQSSRRNSVALFPG
jgi:hypothetical protein